jgi:replicative DNA helicase
MKNLERACLAIVIEYPNLAPIFFANATEDTWTDDDHRQLFLTLQEKWDGREDWSWPELADLHPLTTKLSEALAGLPSCLGKETLIDYLGKIKLSIAKRELMKIAAEEAGKPMPDLDRVREVLQEVTMEGTGQEDASVAAAFNQYLEWIRPGKTGFRTGLPTLDRLTDALNPGELVTFMGRTTSGKTMVALNTMLRIVVQNEAEPVAFFSLEMPKQAIIERLMQMEFQRGRYDLKREVFQDPAGFLQLCEARFKHVSIFDQPYTTGEIEMLIKGTGAKVAFVDFLGLVKSEDRSDSLYQQTTKKITELKQLAKKQSCLVFLMVQLSRAGGDGSIAVTLDMARESGAVEEMSDFVYGIWNPGKDLMAPAEFRDTLTVKLLKNKRGPTHFVDCFFNKQNGLIVEQERADG